MGDQRKFGQEGLMSFTQAIFINDSGLFLGDGTGYFGCQGIFSVVTVFDGGPLPFNREALGI